MISTQVELIEKETVESLYFPNTEVLQSFELIKTRDQQLNKAASLGNLDKFKVKIIFEDFDGRKMVNTTIWALTEKNVVLKAGRTIPINRIHSVLFI